MNEWTFKMYVDGLMVGGYSGNVFWSWSLYMDIVLINN